MRGQICTTASSGGDEFWPCGFRDTARGTPPEREREREREREGASERASQRASELERERERERERKRKEKEREKEEKKRDTEKVPLADSAARLHLAASFVRIPGRMPGACMQPL